MDEHTSTETYRLSKKNLEEAIHEWLARHCPSYPPEGKRKLRITYRDADGPYKSSYYRLTAIVELPMKKTP
jgi:hypothetical protein